MTARVDAQAAKERAEQFLYPTEPLPGGSIQAMAEDVLALVGLLADAEKALDGIRQRRCNGCGQPKRQWGPVCGGMTSGDATHYHSPEWWVAAFDAAGGAGISGRVIDTATGEGR